MSLFSKFKNNLQKTSNFLSSNILTSFQNKKVDRETLEELEVENREYFEKSGGEKYFYIPCLNENSMHIEMIEKIIKKHTQGWPV